MVTKPGYDWEWTRTLFAYKGSGCLESILWLFKRWTPNSLISAVGITNVLLLHFLNEGDVEIFGYHDIGNIMRYALSQYLNISISQHPHSQRQIKR